jgi:hypothetical protein
LASLFRLPFLRKKFVSSPELARVMGRLRKTGRVMTLVRSPSVHRKTPSPKKQVKKTYTNAELVALTRNQLFKLSPTTRARAVKLRAAVRTSPPPKKKANNTPPSPAKVNKRPAPISRAILKSAKFEKLIEKIWRNTGNLTNNGWNKARTKAMNIVQNKGLSLSPNAPAARPHGFAKLAKMEHVRSPKSGRIKIRAPNSGRLVYADGASVSLAHLKNLARITKTNIKGLRSKTQIANKIFGNKK